jgi:excisionase family DNA binding protein
MTKKDQKTITDPQNYTHEQAAKLLGVDSHTLYQWRAAGRGPAYFKMGRMVVYKMADILGWQERNLKRHCPARV